MFDQELANDLFHISSNINEWLMSCRIFRIDFASWAKIWLNWRPWPLPNATTLIEFAPNFDGQFVGILSICRLHRFFMFDLINFAFLCGFSFFFLALFVACENWIYSFFFYPHFFSLLTPSRSITFSLLLVAMHGTQSMPRGTMGWHNMIVHKLPTGKSSLWLRGLLLLKMV